MTFKPYYSLIFLGIIRSKLEMSNFRYKICPDKLNSNFLIIIISAYSKLIIWEVCIVTHVTRALDYDPQTHSIHQG